MATLRAAPQRLPNFCESSYDSYRRGPVPELVCKVVLIYVPLALSVQNRYFLHRISSVGKASATECHTRTPRRPSARRSTLPSMAERRSLYGSHHCRRWINFASVPILEPYCGKRRQAILPQASSASISSDRLRKESDSLTQSTNALTDSQQIARE